MKRASYLLTLTLGIGWGAPAMGLAQDLPAQEAETLVARAIEDLRGVEYKSLRTEELESLNEKLGAAVDTLLENPGPAERAILQVLDTERDDDFLTIDLAWTLILIRNAKGALDFTPTLRALAAADPNAFPQRFFQITSTMAWADCDECLPVVARMLELEELDAYIDLHALPVGIDLGIIFTVGQYGDRALPLALAMLDRPDCASRANAAAALGRLLPATSPERLREMARGDGCEKARVSAWRALGALDEADLPGMALQALAARPALPTAVRLAIVTALRQSFSPAVLAPLSLLTKDGNPEVAAAATEAAAELLEGAPDPTELSQKIGTASQVDAQRVDRALARAIEEQRLEATPDLSVEPSEEQKRLWEAIEKEESEERAAELMAELDKLEGRESAPKFEELIRSLTPDDLARLNSARASVLARLSDECLHDYWLLSYTARALRSVRSGPRAGRWVADPGLAAAVAQTQENEFEEQSRKAAGEKEEPPEACRNELRLFGAKSSKYRDCLKLAQAPGAAEG